MKKQTLFAVAIALTTMAGLSSCTSYHNSMREPNVRVDFNKSDFTLSDQVSAQAVTHKILGIDFARIFTKKTANIDNPRVNVRSVNIPIIGNMINDRTTSYALYELMNSNKGYDVVIYPQYEKRVYKPVLGIGLFYKKTEVKTSARLGKLNK